MKETRLGRPPEWTVADSPVPFYTAAGTKDTESNGRKGQSLLEERSSRLEVAPLEHE